jgi:ABC-2 type transport system permease protein
MTNVFETVYTVWLREIIRFLKSKSRVVGSGGQPFIWLAIAGVGFASAIGVIGGVNYLTFVAPGIIGMTLLFSSIFSGVNVIWDRQFGFLKEILIAPVPRVGIVLGKIAGSATVSLISAVVILVTVVVFGVIPLSDLTVMGLVETVIFMIMVPCTFVSVGLIIASTVDNVEGFQVIINFLVMPLFFLSGALFPLANAPLWMKVVSAVDPLRYGVDGLRGALIGVSSYPVYIDFLAVLASAVVLIIIADAAFSRIEGK